MSGPSTLEGPQIKGAEQPQRTGKKGPKCEEVGVELYEHLEPQSLLMTDSISFGILEARAYVHSREGKENLKDAKIIPSSCFIYLGKITTPPF